VAANGTVTVGAGGQFTASLGWQALTNQVISGALFTFPTNVTLSAPFAVTGVNWTCHLGSLPDTVDCFGGSPTGGVTGPQTMMLTGDETGLQEGSSVSLTLFGGGPTGATFGPFGLAVMSACGSGTLPPVKDPPATVGYPYSSNITGFPSGASSFTASGLPQGFSLSSSSGTINANGTGETPGIFPYSVGDYINQCMYTQRHTVTVGGPPEVSGKLGVWRTGKNAGQPIILFRVSSGVDEPLMQEVTIDIHHKGLTFAMQPCQKHNNCTTTDTLGLTVKGGSGKVTVTRSELDITSDHLVNELDIKILKQAFTKPSVFQKDVNGRKLSLQATYGPVKDPPTTGHPRVFIN
jgi:hypothetical protein